MKYIFLHIPKNGGTSLQAMVDAQYRKWQIYNIPDARRKEALKELKDKSNVAKRLIKVVKGGHFEYGCHSYFKNPKKVAYFAMLRDPIDRALSYYSYVKRTPQHYLYTVFNAENISFDDFVDREDLNQEIANGQTKFIAGMDQLETCTAVQYNAALTHLESNFFLVGIMEQFVETLYMLKTELQWKKPISYKVLNVNKEQKTQISEETLAKLKALNDYDIKIYETYKQQFSERLNNFSEEDLTAFKKLLA